jgi:hypothetical protein
LTFIFALQDTSVDTEFGNEQVGEEEGTVDEPEKMPEEQQPPHRQTPLQKSHTPVSQSGQGNPGTSSSVRKQKRTKRLLYDLSEAVKELRTVNQVLSQPDPRVQENEAFGSYVALELDKLPQREAIMSQNEIQNILTRYRPGLIAAPSPYSCTSSIPSDHIPPSYSSPSFTLTDSLSPSTSTMDIQCTTEPERQEEVGTFADVLPEAWKMSNDVQCLQYNVINKRFVYLLIFLLFTYFYEFPETVIYCIAYFWHKVRNRRLRNSEKILQSAVAVSSCHKMQGHFQHQSW